MQITPVPVKKIAELVGAELLGNGSLFVAGFSEIHRVSVGDCVFVDHPKYYDRALNSAASVIIINKQVEPPAGKATLIHHDPFSAFNQLTKYFNPVRFSQVNVSPTA